MLQRPQSRVELLRQCRKESVGRRGSMGLYTAAAAVLAGVESRQGSLKALVYSSSFQVVGPGAGAGWERGWGARPALAAASVSPAEREAAVRAGVRDAALLGRAGRRDRQRRAPSRREEAAAAPGQGERAPTAGGACAQLCTSSLHPHRAGTDATACGALREGLARAEPQTGGGRGSRPERVTMARKVGGPECC